MGRRVVSHTVTTAPHVISKPMNKAMAHELTQSYRVTRITGGGVIDDLAGIVSPIQLLRLEVAYTAAVLTVLSLIAEHFGGKGEIP